MRIIAFAASTSRKSINKMLVTYAGSLIDQAEVEVLDLNDYELGLFSEDKEQVLGRPELATDFLAKIASADALASMARERRSSSSDATSSRNSSTR